VSDTGSVAGRPLRGRDAEFAELTGILDRLGGCLLIEGPPGSGKSALLDAFRAQAHLRGVAVGHTEADEIDVVSSLNTLTRALAQVLPTDDLERLRDSVGGSYWAIQDIRSMLRKTAADGPLAIVIDDVAWADDASLQALRILVRDLSDHPVSWLFAARPESRPAYRRLRTGRLLKLSPLADPYVGQLIRDIVGGTPDEAVLALVRGHGANLTDLVDRLTDGVASHAFVAKHGRVGLSTPQGERLFADEVAQRLARLSKGARRTIDVAAVLGRSFRLADLTALLDSAAPRLVIELRELMAEHLIVEDAGALAFPHDLVRTAVLDTLPATVRRALNRETALHLLATGSPVVDVAPYVLAASDPDEAGPPALVEAADESTAATADLALAAYQHALEFAGPGSRQWLALVAPTARTLAYGGRLSAADELLDTALARDLEIADEAELRLVQAEVTWLRGRGVDETQALERVLGHPDVPAALNSKIRAVLGSLWVLTGRPADALAAADEAIIAARSVREVNTSGAALLTGSVALGLLGRLNESLAYATESAAVSRRAPTGLGREPRIWLARTLSALDRLDDAEGYCDDVLRDLPEVGNISMLPAAHATRARILLVRGRIRDAVAEAEAGVAVAEATGSTQLLVELWSLLALTHNLTGPPEQARHALRRCEAAAASGILDVGHLAVARAGLLTMDPAEALAACAGLIDQLGHRLGPLAFDPGAAAFLTRVALAAKDRRRAQAVSGAVARLATLNPGVLGWRAASAHVTGLRTENTAALRDAARGFTKVGRHLAAAIALADAGLLGLQRGDAAAEPWLDEATAALTAMGAHTRVAELRGRANTSGPRRGKRATRSQSGWDSLTAAELRVVRLAASGASNKEIAQQLWLSPHTVDTHVRHALEKLGLRSRVEMARQAGERGVTSGDSAATEAVLAPPDLDAQQ
jgi:DNA-binding CsgD family transcriptional regulator/tetratricopeptide (TPR) repeat protein